MVVDTNVLAYLVLPSPQSTVANAVWTADSDWFCPPLLRSELLNVMVKQLQFADADARHLEEMFARAMSLVTFARQPTPREVLRLAARSGCTSYDCEFVAVAETVDAPLVTTDKQVLRAFPQRAMTPPGFVA